MMNKITNPTVFRENIQGKIFGILGGSDNSVSINLEKGIFNYAVKEATRKKIVKKSQIHKM